MEELDFDNMTDEQVQAILDDIQHGKYNDATTESADAGSEEQDTDASENDEDTEGDESTESETETNDEGDGADLDTEDEEDDEGSENTPVEQDTEDNEGDEGTSEGESDGATSASALDATEFERYKKFYDTIANAEFVANGKKVKSFTDPEKIIQAQQMAYGFSDKMASFKKYRPFMASLKDRGMLEDPSKFNFVMDLLDGDTEALKAHIKSLNVDPLDLDMDEVAYSGKNHVTSDQALVLEDTLDMARNYGVEDKLRATIGKEWDQESFNEFLTNPSVRNDLLEHMATGAFDLVQDRIKEMKTLDVSGAFSSMKATDQYRQAVQSLTADATRMNQTGQAAATKEAGTPAPRPTARPSADQAKQAETRAKQEAEYKRNLEEKNRQAAEARKRAASTSKKQTSSTSTKKFDPMSLEGEELDKYVESLIRNGA